MTETISLSCEHPGCDAGISGTSREKALKYMFYHAIGCSHDTGHENAIEEEFDL